MNIFDSDLEVHLGSTLLMFLYLFWLSMKIKFAIQTISLKNLFSSFIKVLTSDSHPSIKHLSYLTSYS